MLDGRITHISEFEIWGTRLVARLPAWVRNEMKTVETEIK